MPDITMCEGEDKDWGICPWRDWCLRYTATPTPGMQSYFYKAPGRPNPKDEWECEVFWEND